MNRSRMMRMATIAVAALLAATAWAEQEVDRTVAAESDGVVTIENIAGSVSVVGWDRDEVRVEGTLTGSAEKLDIDDGDRVRIKVKYPRHAKEIEGGAELVIHVPERSRVEIETISADIEVGELRGRVEAEAISGDVSVTGKCEAVEVGSISGAVTVKSDAARIEVATVSGRIEAEGGTCDVSASSVSGEMKLIFRKLLGLEAQSVSGSMTLAGDLADDGDFEIELHGGDLELAVPSDVNANFRIETFSGEIMNEFGQKSSRTSEYAPGRELEFTNGGGDARVRIDTFNGNVHIKKM